jgi:prolyl-tRNA editing enzyme YbaK/EbsC (Cys-tRNA(Pro) deacylase)
MSIPQAAVRVVEAARALGLEIEIHEFPDGTKTSADAARAVGCELSAIAKSLVFMADGQAVVAILSGDRRLDTAKLAAVTGASSVRRASLDEAREATGFAAGGTPAFGYPSPVPVYMDLGLRRHDQVWSAAGTPTTVYPIDRIELLAAAGASEADLAESGA